MCAVSMIMDHYGDKWQRKLDQYTNYPPCSFPYIPTTITSDEIKEFRELLDRAREYDKKMNQPDCELEEKRKKVKDLAKEMGVEISFV